MRKFNRGMLAGTAMAAILIAIPLADAQTFASPSDPTSPRATSANTAGDAASGQPTDRTVPFEPIDSTTRTRATLPSARIGTAPARAVMPQRIVPIATPDAAQTTAPAAAPSADPRHAPATFSDAEISDRLSALLSGRELERLIPRKDERDAIIASYKSRKFTPLWIVDGTAGERAHAAIKHMQGIDAHGLEPNDYRLPDLQSASPDAAAEAEILFTASLLTYIRHVVNGRVHWSRISLNIDYPDEFVATQAMNTLVKAPNLDRALEDFHPQHPGYQALKAKYAELRAQPDNTDEARIPQGPILRYARDRSGREFVMQDPRVPLIRERLGLKPEPNNNYNKTLASAVTRFQRSQGMAINGRLTKEVIDRLNGPSRQEVLDIILVNLERWRWVPREFGRTHVVLNIPDFHLQVMHAGKQVWRTRVVVGKPANATPLMSDRMRFITVNPIWNVPQSIIHQEIMPLYERGDRSIFQRMGLRVEQRPDGIRVFQPPGDRNALGRLRFNYPNKFLVYMHDTPERQYFGRERRAYSHGCMRVQDPAKFAEVILSFALPQAKLTEARIRQMFGPKEIDIKFQHHIPVHQVYETAFVDSAGRLQLRADVYGIDQRMLAAKQTDERRVADVVMERPADPNYQPTDEDRARLHSVARSHAAPNPFALFEQLFR